MAVVILQAVMELKVEAAFLSLLGLNVPRSFPVLMELLPDRSLMARGTRQLWTELTDDSISDAAHWKAYTKHVERRNLAAHGAGLARLGGHVITRDHAQASLEDVRGLTEHIDRVVGRQLDELLSNDQRDDWRALRVLSPRPVDS